MNSDLKEPDHKYPEGWLNFAEWYGPNANFHDGEVEEICLKSGDKNSYLIVNVVNTKGEQRFFKISWQETIRLTLQDWHSQNVILEMRFISRSEDIHIEIDGSVGLSGEIAAKRITIIPIE